MADSVQTAYQEGQGTAYLKINEEDIQQFSEKFEADGMEFEPPSVNLFNFNNPYGATLRARLGQVLGIDENGNSDPSLSVYEDVDAERKVMSQYKADWIATASQLGTIHRPYHDLTEEQRNQLWNRWADVGINQFFDFLSTKTHKIQYRVMLARYRGYTTCRHESYPQGC